MRKTLPKKKAAVPSERLLLCERYTLRLFYYDLLQRLVVDSFAVAELTFDQVDTCRQVTRIKFDFEVASVVDWYRKNYKIKNWLIFTGNSW